MSNSEEIVHRNMDEKNTELTGKDSVEKDDSEAYMNIITAYEKLHDELLNKGYIKAAGWVRNDILRVQIELYKLRADFVRDE